jgi:16S rRNA (uracil1498-N3)-methyltransferase
VENLPEQKPHLVIATAIPKGKRWQMLVEKCTELGVSEIQPLVCRYSVVEGQGDPGKWERWAVEAAKQCRRAYLPQIKAPVTLPDFLTRHFEGPCLLASPQGDPMMMWGGQIDRAEDTAFIIGPEAGLTEEEEAACYEASYAPVRFAPHILRIETAAIAACALARGLL